VDIKGTGIELAKIEEVVEAATRLVTEEGPEGNGRAIVISTPTLAKGRGKGGMWEMKDVRSKL